MAICGCGLPAHCCQPAFAGGFIYADLRGELSTHLALQALFTQSSPVHELLLQAFPSPSTLGEVTLTSFLRPACLFTAHMGNGSSPLSCGVFLPPPLLQVSCSWLLGVCRHSCLLWPGLFIYSSEGFPFPSLWRSGCPTLFATCLYCSYCLLLSFSFFPWVWSACPGGYADLAQGFLQEYHILLSSPCGPHLPKLSGHQHLVVAWGPSWFLHLM
jgi:hypothetical protein